MHGVLCGARVRLGGALMTVTPDNTWRDWRANLSVDLTKFVVIDLPALGRYPCKPYSVRGLRLAESCAYDLFPIGWPLSDEYALLADRWNRYTLHTIRVLLGCGDWINAPSEFPGQRNPVGLLPILELPSGTVVRPMLQQVLETHVSSPQRGNVLTDALEQARADAQAWIAAGRAEPVPELFDMEAELAKLERHLGFGQPPPNGTQVE